MTHDVFQAIADPTRRSIINLIASKRLNINSVSGHFKVSRPAIYKHIKVLRESGLIVIRQQGRERFCEAKLENLNLVSDWVGQYRKLIDQRLDSLEDYLGRIQSAGSADKKSRD